MQIKDEIVVFTDGASSGNPGPGGYGAVIVLQDKKKVVELGGGKKRTTNNEMELSAILEAFAYLQDFPGKIKVFSDSSYAINGITKWVKNWKLNNWKTKSKEDVSHSALWKELAELVEARSEKISWTHLPGHVGIIGNERTDEIATAFAQGKRLNLYSGPLSKYKLDILNIDIDKIKLADKKHASATSGMKAYSYLSLIDGVLKTHKTWAECEARVKGKKAKFKKAISAEHEKEILKEWGVL